MLQCPYCGKVYDESWKICAACPNTTLIPEGTAGFDSTNPKKTGDLRRYKRSSVALYTGYDEIEVGARGIAFLKNGGQGDRYSWGDFASIVNYHQIHRYRHLHAESLFTDTLVFETRSGKTYNIDHSGVSPHIAPSETFLNEVKHHFHDINTVDGMPPKQRSFAMVAICLTLIALLVITVIKSAGILK